MHFRKSRAYTLAALATLGAAIVSPSAARAQAGRTVDPSVGVLILAHGADSIWNAPVEALAANVKKAGVVQGPVAVTFLMGPSAETHRFQDQVASLVKQGAKRVVLVPLPPELLEAVSG